MNDSTRLPYGYENNVTCTTDKTGRMVINWPEGCRGTVISRELLDDIAEDKNNRPRWIPVTERLPDVDPETMLLVCVQCEDGDRSVDVARWRLDADGKPSWGDICGSNQTIYGWSNLFVTHWMPLPAPPTDAN